MTNLARFFVWFFAAWIVAGIGGSSPAKSAAADPWQNTANRLADTLRNQDASAETALRTLFTDRHALHTFAGSPGSVEQLLSDTHGTVMLATLSYAQTPDTLATDLSTTLNSTDLPASLRKFMTPPDPHSLRRANQTAQKWIAQQLQPRADQPVAAVVLYHPAAGDTPDRLLIVLASGELVGKDLFRINAIAFGPVQPARQPDPTAPNAESPTPIKGPK